MPEEAQEMKKREKKDTKSWYEKNRTFEGFLEMKNKKGKSKSPKAQGSHKKQNASSMKELKDIVRTQTAAAGKPGPGENITAYREESTKKKIGMKPGTGWKSVKNPMIKSQTQELQKIVDLSVTSKSSRLADGTEATIRKQLENSKEITKKEE